MPDSRATLIHLNSFKLGSADCPCSGTAATWIATTKIVPAHVLCYETDTHKFKIADGEHVYRDLPYVSEGDVEKIYIGVLLSRMGFTIEQFRKLPTALISDGINVEIQDDKLVMNLPKGTIGEIKHALVAIRCDVDGNWKLGAYPEEDKDKNDYLSENSNNAATSA